MTQAKALAVIVAAALIVSAARGATSTPRVSIAIRDLTPKFLTFYRAASAPGIGPDERFRLWRQDYGFAAVPPTPDGQQMARRLLDNAWPKYPGVLSRIERGASGIQPSPQAMLTRVADLLRPGKPVDITLVVYVGTLEGNAFTVGREGRATVAIPIEQSPYERGPVMAHEFAHAVQISMGTNSGGWIRSIGETVLSEGLAMRVAQRLYPRRPTASFVETPDEPGWLRVAENKRREILADVGNAAASSDSDDVMRFTMGRGPSGIDREAYYVGWVVTDYWLHHGRSFADIARIPESQAPDEVRNAIDAILRSGPDAPAPGAAQPDLYRR